MTTTKKAVVANYSADVIAAIVNDYNLGRQKGLNNAPILNDLSAKYGKTVPSLRAKLASLKAYVKDSDSSDSTATVEKAKKSDLVLGLESLTGLSLTSLESATKTELLSLAEYIDDLLETVHDLKARI